MPLKNQTVLVTRTNDKSCHLKKGLESHGADVISHPVIEILPLEDFSDLDRQIAHFERFGSVVFVSSNGVTHFFNRATNLPDHSVGFIAIGEATAERIRDALGLAGRKPVGFAEVKTPSRSNSESLADFIINEDANFTGAKASYLIVRADRGSNVLAERLTQSNIAFEEVVAYRSCDLKQADPQVLSLIAQGKIDWITLTSSAIAKSAFNLFGEAIEQGRKLNSQSCKIASISPTTTQSARDCGLAVDTEAKTFDFSGLVDAIKDYGSG